jgi:hypothetical protein
MTSSANDDGGVGGVGDRGHNNNNNSSNSHGRISGPGTPITLTVVEVDALFATTSDDVEDVDDVDDGDERDRGRTTARMPSSVSCGTSIDAVPPPPAVGSTTVPVAFEVVDGTGGFPDNDDDEFRRRADPPRRRRRNGRDIEVTTMEANVALEILESMRRANLEHEFANIDATTTPRHDDCTCCQREALFASSSSRGRMPRVGVGVASTEVANASIVPNDYDVDDATRRPDGDRIGMRSFHGGVVRLLGGRGGGDGNDRASGTVVVAKDDGNGSLRRRFDGSRMRRFGSNVGGFFTKRRGTNAGEDGKRDVDDDDESAEPIDVGDANAPRSNGSGRVRRSNGKSGVLFSEYQSGDRRRDDGEFSAVHGDIGGLFRESSADDDYDYDDMPDEVTTRYNADDTPGETEAKRFVPIEGKVGSAQLENTGNGNEEGSVEVDDKNAMQNSFNASVGTSEIKNSDVGSVRSRPVPRGTMLGKKPSPCLTCGHPTCPRHSSSAFSSKNIPICQACAYLFELDFIVDIIATAADAADFAECRRRVNEMVDCYDRAKLLLSYMAVYSEDVASALEAQAARSNKVKAGSGATSIVSSIAGIVGCGILLFVPPAAVAGVPLLIASLVVGGGATAAQTGDEVVRYFSEPNRLAERMVALHGMATSLLRVKDVLSHVLLRSRYRSEGEVAMAVDEEGSTRRAELANEIKSLLAKHDVTAGASASSFGKGSKFVGRGTRYVGRVCSTAAVIPVAGGLLSAATIYFEGNELKRTLSRISEGNPCAKAEQVRTIGVELDMLPESSLVMEECRLVFELAQKEKTIGAITGDHNPPSTTSI